MIQFMEHVFFFFFNLWSKVAWTVNYVTRRLSSGICDPSYLATKASTEESRNFGHTNYMYFTI